MGTIRGLVEAVPLGVRHSVAVPRPALADALELLRAGADGILPGAAVVAAAALPLTRLFDAIVALDFLDAPLSAAVVERVAAAVPEAVAALAAAVATGGAADVVDPAAAEPPVGEEELRQVIERTAAGPVIWAAVRGTARLEALLLLVPLTPDPTEIRLVDVNIGDDGAERLAARLEAFPQLRVLELPRAADHLLVTARTAGSLAAAGGELQQSPAAPLPWARVRTPEAGLMLSPTSGVDRRPRGRRGGRRRSRR
jgi:hypothetical protein